MKINKSIGFVGCGNMGSAILKGVLSKKIASPKQITIFDADASKKNSISKKYGVHKVPSNADLVRKSQIIILAVKPQELSSAAAEICSALESHHLVISILAGTPISKLKQNLNSRCRIIRAMPNLGAVVGEGITAVTNSKAAAIFSGCGRVIVLHEKYFDLVTAVSGSGPAYFFLLMELLSHIAQKGGLQKEAANLLAIQTAVGAGKLAQNSRYAPDELRHMVTSKKGTTDAALQYLSKNGFSQIFIRAVQEAVNRAKQLSRL